jgi:hypothetical protein
LAHAAVPVPVPDAVSASTTTMFARELAPATGRRPRNGSAGVGDGLHAGAAGACARRVPRAQRR